ncbi:MAG: hypothetical protein ACK5T0_03825, partial [Vampirovibrionales bacterium]
MPFKAFNAPIPFFSWASFSMCDASGEGFGVLFFSRKPMQLYANYLTEEALRRDYYYAFAEKKYPGVPEIILNQIDDKPFRIGDMEIIPIEVWHLKMPVLGFRFGKFTYITDA